VMAKTIVGFVVLFKPRRWRERSQLAARWTVNCLIARIPRDSWGMSKDELGPGCRFFVVEFRNAFAPVLLMKVAATVTCLGYIYWTDAENT
jgi:hypothetical protein